MLKVNTSLGIEMVNAVITKPFTYNGSDPDIMTVALIDRGGRWRAVSRLKGFARRLGGLASSYSSTGDIIVIGTHPSDMICAFQRMKSIGGGLVLVEDGQIVAELPLPIAGSVSDQPMEILMDQEATFTKALRECGYPFSDPIYSLLFLSALHLPYIRLTPMGVVDVMKREVLVPAEI
jgi:adenine deaminase